MQLSRKLLIADYRYPAMFSFPASYTTQQVASVTGANYTLYTVPEDGWYRVSVQAGGGGKTSQRAGSAGGKVEKDVYLYKGMKCLLWSGSNGGNDNGVGGTTGYPGTKNNTFGGRGAQGINAITSGNPPAVSFNVQDSGGRGGGAAENGGTVSIVGSNHNMGGGGAGSGFIAGFTNVTLPPKSCTVGSMTLNMNRNLTIGSVVSYTCIPTYLVCGGGGGASGDNGDTRCSGGGGGAFGSGGTTYNTQTNAAESGPAGSWGKGEDGSRYGAGTKGAWAFIDWSHNGYGKGTGGGTVSGNGYCRLLKIIPN